MSEVESLSWQPKSRNLLLRHARKLTYIFLRANKTGDINNLGKTYHQVPLNFHIIWHKQRCKYYAYRVLCNVHTSSNVHRIRGCVKIVELSRLAIFQTITYYWLKLIWVLISDWLPISLIIVVNRNNLFWVFSCFGVVKIGWKTTNINEYLWALNSESRFTETLRRLKSF